MNKFHFVSVFFFILSIIFFIIGFNSGKVEGGIFIIFPFVKGSGLIGFLGVICLFLSFIFFMFGFSYDINNKLNYFENKDKKIRTKSSKKFGGIVFIGPILIVFGSSLKMIIFVLIIVLIVLLIGFFMLHFY